MLSDGHLEIKTSPATATINYKAKFDNTDDTLWPGQFVDVRIQFAIRRNVIAVPVTAVQHGPDGAYVFVVDGYYVAQKRPIKVGSGTRSDHIKLKKASKAVQHPQTGGLEGLQTCKGQPGSGWSR